MSEFNDHGVPNVPMSGTVAVGRSYALRPLAPADYGEIYMWAMTPPASASWRLRGATPHPDAFASLIWEGVSAQFAVVNVQSGRLHGLVQVFNYDTYTQTAYYSVVVAPECRQTSTAMAEATVLLLRYAFDHFPLRKIYAETSALAIPQIEQIALRWPCAEVEGQLRDHLCYAGQYFDLIVLGIHRDAFEQDYAAMRRWLRRGTTRSGNSPEGLTFRTFVEQLPDSVTWGERAVIHGGTRLSEDIGIDSMALIELVCQLEDTYDADLVSHGSRYDTVQDLFDAVTAKGSFDGPSDRWPANF